MVNRRQSLLIALFALAAPWAVADEAGDIISRAEQAASAARESEFQGWIAAGRAEAAAARARAAARRARELEAGEVSTVEFESGRFVGQIINGDPHGLGVWHIDDETRYEGELVDGAMHGLGVLFLPGDDRYNSRYEGEFAEDVPEGYGIWQWQDARSGRDGDREAGVWVDGQLDGAFTYVYLEGEYAGTLVAGEMDAESQIGQGVLDYADATVYAGSRYEGELSGHYAHGYGLWRFDDRSTTYGRWRQDEAQEDESVTIDADGMRVESSEVEINPTDQETTPEQVRQAQELLSALGYQTGPADGIPDRNTADAIAHFQADHGLEVTSTVSAVLIDQLRVALAARGEAALPPDHLELESRGTGFVVSESGHLLTNHHVVDGCDAMRVRDLGWADVLAFDEELDLALIVLKSGRAPGVASFRSWPPVVMGEAVVIFGFPQPELLSASGNVTTGVVSALEGGADFDFHQYQFTAPIQDGNSGGPLLDGAGNVIGVVAAAYGDLQAVNFAVKGEVASSFLIENGLQPDLTSGKAAQPRPTENVVAEAMRHTFQLECWIETRPSLSNESLAPEGNGTLEFGVDDLHLDDLGEWNLDGECDDPRFVGDDMADPVFTSLVGRDATDCRALFNAGSIRLRQTGEIVGLEFGDDSGTWVRDGECDDPSFEGTGMGAPESWEHILSDASDCRDAFAAGTVRLRIWPTIGGSNGADSSTSGPEDVAPEGNGTLEFGVDDLHLDDLGEWNLDGECDDPRFVGDDMADPVYTSLVGRDASDCRALFNAGTIRLRQTGEIVGLEFGDDSGARAHDGECDDPSFEGTGMGAPESWEHILSDASDCRDAFAAGTVRLPGE